MFQYDTQNLNSSNIQQNPLNSLKNSIFSQNQPQQSNYIQNSPKLKIYSSTPQLPITSSNNLNSGTQKTNNYENNNDQINSKQELTSNDRQQENPQKDNQQFPNIQQFQHIQSNQKCFQYLKSTQDQVKPLEQLSNLLDKIQLKFQQPSQKVENNNIGDQNKSKESFSQKQILQKLEDPMVQLHKSFQKQISIQDFQIGKCIGRGKFGSVYLSKHIETNFLLAIKQISKKTIIQNNMQKQLQQEIKIQTYLNHPNILKMYGFLEDFQNIYLLLELSEQGSIQKEIKKQNAICEQKAVFYIRQICEGLQYLHSLGIIHRDLKPENILNCFGVLKISDFGWSICTKEKRETFCGTLDYVPPEIFQGKNYDYKVDMWTIGVLTYELLTGQLPFDTKNPVQGYQDILDVKFDFPDYISEDAKTFINQLLTKDPNKRVNIEDALQSEWICQNTNKLINWNQCLGSKVFELIQ